MAKPAAGYSGKTLAAKLGIVAGSRVAAIAAPKHYEELLGDGADGATIARFAKKPLNGKTFDIVHLFADRLATLDAALAPALAAVKDGGMLWISWPKKSSPMFIDLTDVVVRNVALKTNFVDVKVAAVDETWSGLKFLRRKK